MRYLALLLGALLVGACSTTAPNQGLDTRVALDRTVLKRGETVTITVTVTGGTLQGSSSCLSGYNVLDASGTVVAPGDVICTADLVTRSAHVRPYVRQFSWAGYAGTGVSGTPLPADIYEIVGGTGPAGNVHGSVSAPVLLELVD
jgi:hypothetical protein